MTSVGTVSLDKLVRKENLVLMDDRVNLDQRVVKEKLVSTVHRVCPDHVDHQAMTATMAHRVKMVDQVYQDRQEYQAKTVSTVKSVLRVVVLKKKVLVKVYHPVNQSPNPPCQ